MEKNYDQGYDDGYSAGFREGRSEGYSEGYDVGYEEGQEEQSEETFDDYDALKMLQDKPKKYSVFETKTLDDQFKAELLKTAFEKLSLNELERIFSRHQRKLFGYTLIR
jgi:flagellar biosynthesis/type III secretory pathway protein FliH